MFIDTATFRTSTRGIAGIDVDNFHTVQSCFVAYFLFKIIECPAMQCGSLRLSNRYPVADAAQIFQSNSAPSALSLNHDAFADTVIGVVREAIFFACQLTQTALGRLRAFYLQRAPQSPMAMPDVIHAAAFVDLSVAIHGDVDNSPVYAKKRFDFSGRWLLNLPGCHQVEPAVVEPQ